MAAIEVSGLTHRYGRVEALSGVDLAVPEGSVFALLGPNGAGKTTLVHILMGLLAATSGRAKLFGRDTASLRPSDRASIGYVAEGQALPEWMRLRALESWLAPLYPEWDGDLADELRHRFRLDADRRIRTFSRGERMKAALLCALAQRPRLLILDEPFAGLDVAVKDELVRGFLGAAAERGTTILIATHDLAEVETLIDGVAFLDRGRLLFSAMMDEVRARFTRVEAAGMEGGDATAAAIMALEDVDGLELLSVERAGSRVGLLVSSTSGEVDEARARQWFPTATWIDVRPASLREIFIAIARGPSHSSRLEEVGA